MANLPSSNREPSPIRRLLVHLGLILCLTVLGFQLVNLAARPGLLSSTDFAMYWAAGRLNAAGINPYDPDRLLSLEREVDPDLVDPFIAYSPPWVLTLVMPFGLLNSQLSRLL